MIRLLPIEAATYETSALHGSDRIWQETNCYVDLWIEALHALGVDPAVALAFTLSADFDGDQWRFIKYPLEDLRRAYGLEVSEMNPWRGMEHHIAEQLEMGRWLTIEVDSYFLPDTAGTAYRSEHVKTSIVPNMIDQLERRLGYFHGAGYYELSDADFDGLLHRGGTPPGHLPPYVELVKLDQLIRLNDDDQLELARSLVSEHLARRPPSNPVHRMAARFPTDADWLTSHGMDAFHLYSFATFRQCGSTAELASTLCGWLADRGEPTIDSRDKFAELASSSKSVQFKLARLAAGRDVDVASMIQQMSVLWDEAMAPLVDRYLVDHRSGEPARTPAGELAGADAWS